jgi:hypothetical protein
VHNGFFSVSQDEDTGDKFYMREIQEVLARYNRRFDVIGFDAGLAGMLENAYALRDCGSIMVGSEDVEPGGGWSYDGFLGPLRAERHITPEGLARLMVDSYRNHYGDREVATLSAIDLTKVTPLAEAVSQFGHLPDHDARWDYFEAIRQARNACQDYGYGPEAGVAVNSIDLGRFLDQVTQVPNVGKALAKTAANAKAALQDPVIDSYASSFARACYLLSRKPYDVPLRPRLRCVPRRKHLVPSGIRRQRGVVELRTLLHDVDVLPRLEISRIPQIGMVALCSATSLSGRASRVRVTSRVCSSDELAGTPSVLIRSHPTHFGARSAAASVAAAGSVNRDTTTSRTATIILIASNYGQVTLTSDEAVDQPAPAVRLATERRESDGRFARR